jgi:hypothetical protein
MPNSQTFSERASTQILDSLWDRHFARIAEISLDGQTFKIQKKLFSDVQSAALAGNREFRQVRRIEREGIQRPKPSWKTN